MSAHRFGSSPAGPGTEQRPFCTSPSELQDASLEPDLASNSTLAVGLRSPGKTSPYRGRTMKEYEELLGQLRNENFNLKLRIYFLDERAGRMGAPDSHDDDHLREMESLRKENADKQELLCQAARVVEILEEQHRTEIKKMSERLRVQENLEKKILNLEKELGHVTEEANKETNIKNELEDKILKVEVLLEQRDQKLKCCSERIEELETLLSKKEPEMEYKIQELNQRDNDILEKNSKIEQLALKINDLNSLVTKREEEIKQLTLVVDNANVTIATLKKELLQEKTEIKSVSSQSEESGGRLEAVVYRTQEELQHMEDKLEEMRQQLQQQTRAHDDLKLCLQEKERKLAELTTLYKKSLLTIQTFSRMCRERSREVDDLRETLQKQQEGSRTVSFSKSDSNICSNGISVNGDQSIDKAIQVTNQCGALKDVSVEENELLLAELDQKNKHLLQLAEERDSLSSEMEHQMQALLVRLKEKEQQLENCMQKLSNVELELERRIKNSDELEHKLSQLQTNMEVKNDSSLLRQLEEKNQEIERLNAELKKRTSNLQELVNKELWDKNRVIEKLQDKITLACERKDVEISNLQQQLMAREQSMQLMQERLTELCSQLSAQPPTLSQHVHVSAEEPELRVLLAASMKERGYLAHQLEQLRERLQNTPERDNDSKLCLQLAAANERVKCAEEGRKEVVEVCSLLTRRLEELARFLLSLLKRSELLSHLAPEYIKDLERVAESNVELSQTLSLTICEAQEPNSSVHMASVSGLLDLSSIGKSLLELCKMDNSDLVLDCEKSCDPVSKEQNPTCIPVTSNNSLDSPRSKRSLSPNKLTFSSRRSSVSSKTAMSPPRIVSARKSLFQDRKSMSPTKKLHSPNVQNSLNQLNVESPHCRVTNTRKCLSTGSSPARLGSGVPTVLRRSSSAGAQLCVETVNASESETWSEPDRSVSLARIGLTEDSGSSTGTARLRLSKGRSLIVSSESEEDTVQEISRSSGRRLRESEGRNRLYAKIRALQQVNDELRGELGVLQQIASSASGKSTCDISINTSIPVQEDKSTCVDELTSPKLTETTELLQQIRRQRHKLEASLRHNDLIQKWLEAAAAGTGGSGDARDLCDVRLKTAAAELAEARRCSRELQTQLLRSEISTRKLQEAQEAVHTLQEQISELETKLKEKDNEILEQQCSLLESRNVYESRCLQAERALEEEHRRSQELEQEIEMERHRASTAETRAHQQVQEAERLGAEFAAGLRRQVEEAQRQARAVRAEVEARVQEAEERHKQREAEAEHRWREADAALRKHHDEITVIQSQAALERTRLLSEQMRLEQALRRQEAREAELAREHHEECCSLQHQRERLEAQVLSLEQSKQDLQHRLAQLEYTNRHLEQRLNKLFPVDRLHLDSTSGHVSGSSTQLSLPQRKMDEGSLSSGLDTYSGDGGSLPSSSWSLPHGGLPIPGARHHLTRQRSELSDYLSEDIHAEEYDCAFPHNGSKTNLWSPTSEHGRYMPSSRNINSPDLGIESDQGRFSSLEAPTRVLCTEVARFSGSETEAGSEGENNALGLPADNGNNLEDENIRLQKENDSLKRNLSRTKRLLEATVTQLTSSNQLKRQMERAICKQLHKTHHVLKQAKGDCGNMGYTTGE